MALPCRIPTISGDWYRVIYAPMGFRWTLRRDNSIIVTGYPS